MRKIFTILFISFLSFSIYGDVIVKDYNYQDYFGTEICKDDIKLNMYISVPDKYGHCVIKGNFVSSKNINELTIVFNIYNIKTNSTVKKQITLYGPHDKNEKYSFVCSGIFVKHSIHKIYNIKVYNN